MAVGALLATTAMEPKYRAGPSEQASAARHLGRRSVQSIGRNGHLHSSFHSSGGISGGCERSQAAAFSLGNKQKSGGLLGHYAAKSEEIVDRGRKKRGKGDSRRGSTAAASFFSHSLSLSFPFDSSSSPISPLSRFFFSLHSLDTIDREARHCLRYSRHWEKTLARTARSRSGNCVTIFLKQGEEGRSWRTCGATNRQEGRKENAVGSWFFTKARGLDASYVLCSRKNLFCSSSFEWFQRRGNASGSWIVEQRGFYEGRFGWEGWFIHFVLRVATDWRRDI